MAQVELTVTNQRTGQVQCLSLDVTDDLALRIIERIDAVLRDLGANYSINRLTQLGSGKQFIEITAAPGKKTFLPPPGKENNGPPHL